MQLAHFEQIDTALSALLRAGAKQWASRSVREAIEQLQERRRRQIWVLERKLSRARDDHYLAERTLLQSPLAGPPEIV